MWQSGARMSKIMADTIVRESTPTLTEQQEIQTGLVPYTMSYEERHAGLLALLAERMADRVGVR